MRFQPAQVDEGVRGVLELLARKGMLSSGPRRGQRQEIYYRVRWVRVDDGGILLSNVELGDSVKVGDVLGAVTDPISSERTIVRSPLRRPGARNGAQPGGDSRLRRLSHRHSR